MQTISLSAHFDGKQILLDEPFPLAENTRLLVTVVPETETERDLWLRLSAQRLSDAYSDDEPDYDLSSIREINPNYDGG